MCGISGILIFDNQIDKLNLIKKMTDVLSHRGPDGEGFWTNDKNISLGHRRLSIIDLSEKGSQPMISADGRYVTVFNGEIYNYIELKGQLIQKGHTFRTLTDTEVILNLYMEMGEDMLSEIDGMFAIAIWDELSQSLFCARDRYGEKPFYFSKSGDEFLFASEMKSLFSVKKSARIQKNMFANYILNDLVTDPENESATFYEGINKLEKSHYLVVDSQGNVRKKRYYSIQLSPSSAGFEHSKSALVHLLTDSVIKRLRSDVSIGTSLSGGLDSSILAYLINENIQRKEGLNNNVTFSAKFHENEYSESEYIDCVLNDLGLQNKSVYPNDQLIHQEIENIFYHQEEPFQSASILNQWSVMRLASENGTKVLLDGQGADELLGGYNWYYKIYLKELYQKSFRSYRQELKLARENNFKYQSLNFKDWARLKNRFLDGKASKVNHFIKKYHPVLKDFQSDFTEFDLNTLPFVKSYQNNLNLAFYQDFNTYVLETLLRFSDRNAMAFSVEVRLPYLAKNFVDLMFTLPSEYKIKGGWKKYILRKAFEAKLPPKIIWRRDKRGYEAPQNDWLKSKENQVYLNDCFLTLQNKNVLSKKAKLNNSNQWKVLMSYNLLNFTEKYKT